MTALHIYGARHVHVLEFLLVLAIDSFQVCTGRFLLIAVRDMRWCSKLDSPPLSV